MKSIVLVILTTFFLQGCVLEIAASIGDEIAADRRARRCQADPTRKECQPKRNPLMYPKYTEKYCDWVHRQDYDSRVACQYAVIYCDTMHTKRKLRKQCIRDTDPLTYNLSRDQCHKKYYGRIKKQVACLEKAVQEATLIVPHSGVLSDCTL